MDKQTISAGAIEDFVGKDAERMKGVLDKNPLEGTFVEITESYELPIFITDFKRRHSLSMRNIQVKRLEYEQHHNSVLVCEKVVGVLSNNDAQMRRSIVIRAFFVEHRDLNAPFEKG